MTPARFLRDYWQKQPLLLKQAFAADDPDLGAVTAEQLFSLGQHDHVESRLITRPAEKWAVEDGPFRKLPGRRTKNWTLLVQGVNLHSEAADRLMRRMSFIPYARLDDLMVSFASDGGGVGAHLDSYDVFLLQIRGTRRWRISSSPDQTLIENVPLKLLKHFQAEEEYLLEPGDMLYLPPHYAHEGTAVGECMTASFGFRAPSFQELGEAFLNQLSDTIDLPGRYADPDLKATSTPAKIDTAMLSRFRQELQKIQFTDDDMTLFIGEYLTEPKPLVSFIYPAEIVTPAKFHKAVQSRGVRLDPKSQMLYYKQHLFLNGYSLLMGNPEDQRALTRLADQRQLEGEWCKSLSADAAESLMVWFTDGWLHIN